MEGPSSDFVEVQNVHRAADDAQPRDLSEFSTGWETTSGINFSDQKMGSKNIEI